MTLEQAKTVGVCHRCPHLTSGVSGSAPCKLDGIDIIVHATEGVCPDGRYGVPVWPADFVAPEPGPVTTEPQRVPGIKQAGPRLWKELEDHAAAGTLTDAVANSVAAQLPCGQCKDHFAAWRASNQLRTPADVRRLHNAVNRLRRVPEWPEL
jgi:hypothetical protein